MCLCWDLCVWQALHQPTLQPPPPLPEGSARAGEFPLLCHEAAVLSQPLPGPAGHQSLASCAPVGSDTAQPSLRASWPWCSLQPCRDTDQGDSMRQESPARAHQTSPVAVQKSLQCQHRRSSSGGFLRLPVSLLPHFPPFPPFPVQSHAAKLKDWERCSTRPWWEHKWSSRSGQGTSRHKPAPPLPISSVHWACTRTELEEFQIQINPIQEEKKKFNGSAPRF